MFVVVGRGLKEGWVVVVMGRGLFLLKRVGSFRLVRGLVGGLLRVIVAAGPRRGSMLFEARGCRWMDGWLARHEIENLSECEG